MSEPFWTPLGGQPVDYEGAWSAGFQYAPGDVVVYNGVTYLAVNPSLGVAPPISGYSFLDVGPEVAYAELTGSVSITATTEATAQVVVTAPAFIADGSSQYLVEFFVPHIQPAGAVNATHSVAFFVDGVTDGRVGIMQTPAAAGFAVPMRLARRLTPAAGSRTISVRAWVSTGTGQLWAGLGGAGNYTPGFIRVTKVPTALPVTGGAVPAQALVTALPASPVDGQQVVLVDSLTAPTYQWKLLYVAGKASNRWVFVGGAPAIAEVAAMEVTPAGSFGDCATVGPSLTIPVAGLYEIGIGHHSDNATTGGYGYMSYSVAGAAVNAADGTRPWEDAGRVTVASRFRTRAFPVGTVVAKYQGGAQIQASYRWMRIQPVAVGG